MQACTDIELEHNVFAGVCRKYLDRAPALYRREFRLMVMKACAKTKRFNFFGSVVQSICNRLPAIETLDSSGAGHNDELAPDDLIKFNGVSDVVRRE